MTIGQLGISRRHRGVPPPRNDRKGTRIRPVAIARPNVVGGNSGGTRRTIGAQAPINWSARARWALYWRVAWAIFGWPCSRNRLIAKLRRLAIVCGPEPVRICERSSSKVTSRTQCTLFSIPQCPCTKCKRMSGGASSGRQLVTPYAYSCRQGLPCKSVVSRSMRKHCSTCGNQREPRNSVRIQIRRRSIRPWPFWRVSA